MKKISTKSKSQQLALALVVPLVAITGVWLLVGSRAATSSVVADLQAGQVGIPARVVDAPDAAGGQAVAFSSVPLFFSPTSFWNQKLADNAPLIDPSQSTATKLANQANYTPTSTPVAGYYPKGYNSAVAMGQYSTPLYTVPANQPTAPVVWVDGNGKAQPASWACGLQDALAKTPVPVRSDGKAIQANGTDGHVVIYQPSTDTMWEFWVFEDHGAGANPRYTAGYGGRIDNVSQSNGVLRCNWGMRAISLAGIGGVIMMQDYINGVIPHALAMSVPVAIPGHLAPATRDDGSTVSATPSGSIADGVLEGSRYRLPANYNCGALPNSTKLLQMICLAAKNYGIVIIDKTGGSSTFYAEDDRSIGTPYQTITSSPWTAIGNEFYDKNDVMNKFPWYSLAQLAPTNG